MVSSSGIKIYCYLNIFNILDFDMEIKEGRHGKISLRGYLSDNAAKAEILKDKKIKITICEDEKNKETILFQGVIQSLHIFEENGVRQIVLSAATNDIILDKEERSNSYQDSSSTFLKIVKEKAISYHGKVLCKEPAMKIEHSVIQYKETDWQFCKRMAAEMGLNVFSNPISSFPCMKVGLVEEKEIASFAESEYKVCVDEEYYHYSGVQRSKKEFLYYQIETDKNYEIGTAAVYQGQKRYIFEKKVELHKEKLTFFYKLGSRCRFESACKYHNDKIVGLSLEGEVKKTEKQLVYLQLDIDGSEGQALYPYPWIPITGSFLYCMPQIGTKVQLYFPDADEKHAIAVNSIHINSASNYFIDYQKRGLVTEYGRQVQMFPDIFAFVNGMQENSQGLFMQIDRLSIQNDNGKLCIIGKEKVLFKAPNIFMSARNKIGQYKAESCAKEKETELKAKGSRNPVTGGPNATVEMQNECNVLSEQGVLYGTIFEKYVPFPELDYEKYTGVSHSFWKACVGALVAVAVGVAIGALVVATGGFGLVAVGSVAAGVLGAAVGGLTATAGIAAAVATRNNDIANGTNSSWGEYIYNSLSASVKVGGSALALLMVPHAANIMLPYLVNLLGGTFTFTQIMGGLTFTLDAIAIGNMAFQMNDVTMFAMNQKGLGEKTGHAWYDNTEIVLEIGAFAILLLGAVDLNTGMYNGAGTGETIADGAATTDTLSATALKHPLNRHMPLRVAQQFLHMNEAQINKNIIF